MAEIKIKTQSIGTGDSAIFKTIEVMKRLARNDATDPNVAEIAQKIERKCSDEACKAVAAFDYVFKNIKYKYDHENALNFVKSDNPQNIELVTAPRHLADPDKPEITEEDCDGMATFLAALYLAMGMRCRFRVIAHKNNEFSHVYAEVGLRKYKVWIPSDPVIGKFGIEKAPIIRAKSFEV